MENSRVIVAIGVCHRDVELASLWLRWVSFLSGQPGGDRGHILVVYTHRTNPKALQEAARGMKFVNIVRCPDEDESGYPKSASHLFLRTLEGAEKLFPGSPVLWCEPDTVPMKPTWFSEIAAEYRTCGKPFLGMRVGTQYPHLSGNACYPANWRELAPSIADVLNAPDYKLWGPGKGQPWDVYCRHETTPQMAESRLMEQQWKERDARGTKLSDIKPETCLFHQDKAGILIREIANARYPDFMATLRSDRKFYFMNGHPSRLRVKGVRIRFSYTKPIVGGHRSAVCSDELDDNEAAALAALVGQLGVREMTESEFLNMTGRHRSTLPSPRVRAAAPAPVVASPEVENVTHQRVFVMLGRYGDICNILPMLKAEADAGRRPTLVVSKDFADILDGVSYVDRIVWDGPYDQLGDALRWLRKNHGIQAPVICQCHRHPTDKARLTDSYQREVWRLAGRLPEFENRGPLVFDRRDQARERELVGKIAATLEDNPLWIVVGLNSASSPLDNAPKIMAAIRAKFTKSFVVDLATVTAERIYDLIAVFEAASVVVTSDTSFLHLARAVNRDVVALINDGWRGSVPHELCTTIRYRDVTPDRVTEAISAKIHAEVADFGIKRMGKTEAMRQAAGPRIFHAVDAQWRTERNDAAQISWAAAYREGISRTDFVVKRNAATELGDPRPLPFLKDLLWAAIPDDARDQGDAIVLWTNADIALPLGTAAAIAGHISKHHAATMRRTESNGEGHPGRDLFAFTVDWLHEHWDKIPDYVVGGPVFDLGIAAMIRKFHGLPALTMKNLSADIPPAEMKPGLALHASHQPEWNVPNVDSVPSVQHNKRLFRDWARKHAPEIRFSAGGNLK